MVIIEEFETGTTTTRVTQITVPTEFTAALTFYHNLYSAAADLKMWTSLKRSDDGGVISIPGTLNGIAIPSANTAYGDMSAQIAVSEFLYSIHADQLNTTSLNSMAQLYLAKLFDESPWIVPTAFEDGSTMNWYLPSGNMSSIKYEPDIASARDSDGRPYTGSGNTGSVGGTGVGGDAGGSGDAYYQFWSCRLILSPGSASTQCGWVRVYMR